MDNLAPRKRGRPRKERPIEGKPNIGKPDSDAYLEKIAARAQAEKRAANPQHVASDSTRRMISNMAGYGLGINQIKMLTGLTVGTLYHHYGKELKQAAARKDLAVIQSAFLQAVGGPEQQWEKARSAMTKWWLECRMPGQWRPPPQQLELDARMTYMDLSKLSDRELDQLERIMMRYEGQRALADSKTIEGDIEGEAGESPPPPE